MKGGALASGHDVGEESQRDFYAFQAAGRKQRRQIVA